MKTYRIAIALPREFALSLEEMQRFLSQLHQQLKKPLSLQLWSENHQIYLGIESRCLQTQKSALALLRSFTPYLETLPAPNIVPKETFFLAPQEIDILPITDMQHPPKNYFLSLLQSIDPSSFEGSLSYTITLQPLKEGFALWTLLRWKTYLWKISRFFHLSYWMKSALFQKKQQQLQAKLPQKFFRVQIALHLQAKAAVMKSKKSQLIQCFKALATRSSNPLQMQRKGKHFLLTPREIATIFHFPAAKDFPQMVHVRSQKLPPPAAALCKDSEMISFGESNYQNQHIPFGMYPEDRRRHLYLIGKSGSGKSKCLELFIQSDAQHNRGFAVIDPHGDLIDNALKLIPRTRVKDIFYLDTTKEAYLLPFNPLSGIPEAFKAREAAGILEIFKKHFQSHWNHRLEHVLRNAILALLDLPEPSLPLLSKLLSDKNFRHYTLEHLQQENVKHFWMHEFSSWNQQFHREAIAPILNKLGELLMHPTIKNMLSATSNTIDIEAILNEGKIFLAKIPKGVVGSESAAFLGSLIITKIFFAAMRRAEKEEKARKDFYCYLDEFQNFTTDLFQEMFSESRKYRLNLIVAHQFLGQLSPSLKETILGNVGSIITFRLSGADAAVLAKEYHPYLSPEDLMNLGVREFYCKLSIKGTPTRPFSGRTKNVYYPRHPYEILSLLPQEPFKPSKPSFSSHPQTSFSEPFPEPMF